MTWICFIKSSNQKHQRKLYKKNTFNFQIGEAWSQLATQNTSVQWKPMITMTMTTKQSGRHGLADSEIRSKMLPCTHRGRHSWQSNLKSQTRTNNNASLIDWVWSRFWIQQSWSLDSHVRTPDWNLDFTFNDTSENEWHCAHGTWQTK